MHSSGLWNTGCSCNECYSSLGGRGRRLGFGGWSSSRIMEKWALSTLVACPFGENKHGMVAFDFGAPFGFAAGSETLIPSFPLPSPFPLDLPSPFPGPVALPPSPGDFALAFGLGFAAGFGRPLASSACGSDGLLATAALADGLSGFGLVCKDVLILASFWSSLISLTIPLNLLYNQSHVRVCEPSLESLMRSMNLCVALHGLRRLNNHANLVISLGWCVGGIPLRTNSILSMNFCKPSSEGLQKFQLQQGLLCKIRPSVQI